MGVRLRITLLFSLIVLIILMLVCGSVYFFSYQNRLKNIQTRLTNRAITTARLLSQSESFDRNLIRKIDSATTLSLVNKSIQAYDFRDELIYAFSDLPGDTLAVNKGILDKARSAGNIYFTSGDKDVIACHVRNRSLGVVMIAGAVDKDGKEKLRQLRLIILVSFIGGLVTLAILLIRSQADMILAIGLPIPNSLLLAKKIPYGVAIAIGGFVAFPSSPLFLAALESLK